VPHRSDRYGRFCTLNSAIRDAHNGVLPSADKDIMRLALALRDHVVRDACLMYLDGELRDGAELLWRYLVRATPGPDRAEPAVLLAITAFFAGDGVTAGLALEHARSAHPEHRLTELMTEVLAYGMTPEELAPAIHAMFIDALDQVMKSSP
jgi:hypothetical protein